MAQGVLIASQLEFQGVRTNWASMCQADDGGLLQGQLRTWPFMCKRGTGLYTIRNTLGGNYCGWDKPGIWLGVSKLRHPAGEGRGGEGRGGGTHVSPAGWAAVETLGGKANIARNDVCLNAIG